MSIHILRSLVSTLSGVIKLLYLRITRLGWGVWENDDASNSFIIIFVGLDCIEMVV